MVSYLLPCSHCFIVNYIEQLSYCCSETCTARWLNERDSAVGSFVAQKWMDTFGGVFQAGQSSCAAVTDGVPELGHSRGLSQMHVIQ